MKNILKKIKINSANSRGDTIVEVIISLAVLALVLVTAFVSSNHSLEVGINSGNRSQALSYSQKQIELIKDAANNDKQDTYLSYIQNADESANTTPFCIDDQGHRIDTPPGPGGQHLPVCDTSQLPDQAPYQTGIQYGGVSTKLFTITTQWPGATGNDQRLNLAYRPTNPGPRVHVTISVADSDRHPGLTTTIHWTAINAKKCDANNQDSRTPPQNTASLWGGSGNQDRTGLIRPDGTADATEGSGTFNPPSLPMTYTFTIHCTNEDSDASAPAYVTVTQWPPPTCSPGNCSATPTVYGRSNPNPTSNISWNVSDAQQCYKNGGPWGVDSVNGIGYSGGPLPQSGLTNYNSSVDYTWILRCTNQAFPAGVNFSIPLDVTPEDLTVHMWMFGTQHDNQLQCAYEVPTYGGGWLCGPFHTHTLPSVRETDSDGGYRYHAPDPPPGGAGPLISDCTIGYRGSGYLGQSQTELQNFSYPTENDPSHRWKTCGGYWYADRGSAGLPGVRCEMWSNGINYSGGGGIWNGGLPIKDAYPNDWVFIFPHGGWAKSDGNGNDDMRVKPNLEVRCSDNGAANGGVRDYTNDDNAHDCYPSIRPGCPLPPWDPQLNCNITDSAGNITGDQGYSQGETVYFRATGGSGLYSWNNGGYGGSATFSTTAQLPMGRHQMGLNDGDLQYNACVYTVIL